MNTYSYLVVAILLGMIIGFITGRLKVTAGYFIGALIAVASLNLITGKVISVPLFTRTVQCLSGMVIASSVAKSDIKNLKKFLMPIVMIVAGLVLVNLLIGYLLYSVSGLTLSEALLGSCPGGLADMAIIADDYGADMVIVAFLQLVRFIGIILTISFTSKLLSKKMQKKSQSENCENNLENTLPKKINPNKENLINFILTFIVAVLGSVIGILIKIPSGALIGSMILCTILNISTKNYFTPSFFKLITKILLGVIIGLRVTIESIFLLKILLLPSLLISISMIVFSYVMGYFLHKTTKLDYLSAVLACAPGGISEMTMLSEDLKANTSVISIIHSGRIFGVLISIPNILELFLNGF